MGLRVAGRMAGERLAGAADAPARPVAVEAQPRVAANRAAKGSGSVARGVGGFLKPFHRVGGTVFLEVTGAFFLLFVLVFGQMVWRYRLSFAAGPDHAKLLAAAALMAVFLYLSVSSFWRARRRSSR